MNETVVDILMAPLLRFRSAVLLPQLNPFT